MTPTSAQSARFTVGQRRAFTLIELLVVIAIIGVMMALAFPAIRVMQRLTRGGATETTIGVAVRAASAYASKPHPPLTSGAYTVKSNGAAILFTPNGDIRILETDRLAFSTPGSGNVLLQSLPVYGYKDVYPIRDYISMPNQAGVVGIARRGGDLYLLAPPFAVRFDRFGQITTASANTVDEATQMVFYDSNYDGRYDLNSNRPNNYNPDDWDTRINDSVDMDDAGLRPELEFERIETVAGILTFSLDDFRAAGHDLEASGGNLSNGARDWLLETNADGTLKNAKTLFFSRNSGAILKEYR